MGVVVRLRMELANSPGSLARAAAVIADYGGNITAVDVLQAMESLSIDDVTVDFPASTDLGAFRREMHARSAARIISQQKASDIDLMVRVLRRLAAALAAPSYEPADALMRGVAELCATPAVWVTDATVAQALGAGRLALEHRGEPALARSKERLPALAETVSGEAWILAVACRGVSDPQVVFAARTITQGFTETEMGRVAALVAVYDEAFSHRTASLSA